MRRLGIALAVLLAALSGLAFTDPAFWLRYAGAHLRLAPVAALVPRPLELVGAETGQEWPMSPETERAAALGALAVEAKLTAFVLVKNGAVVAEQYAAPTNASSLVDGGAMGRLLAVLAAGSLLSDGAFPAYDSAIGTWLPGFAEAPRSAITLAHLLTQSSGLATPRLKIAPYSSSTQFLLGSDIDAALDRLPSVAAPGTLRQENPADAQLLLQTIERARGEDFARLFERRLWRPIGAGAAQFTRDAHGGRILGHCCFAARARDWVRLGQLFVDRGRVGPLQVLPAQFLEDVSKPSALDARFGMGVERLGAFDENLPADLVLMRGGGGQYLWVSPSAGLSISAVFPAGREDTAAFLRRALEIAGVEVASRPGDGAEPR